MSDEQSASVVFEWVAEQMNAGVPRDEIVEMLVAKGTDQGVAEQVVGEIYEIRGSALREAGQKNMRIGALWFIGGLVVTGITYSAAANGGTYVVTWGAIIFGAVQFFKGWSLANQR